MVQASRPIPAPQGGYAITPTAASGLAAFYSAIAKFVTLLASLPQGGNWVRGGQDLGAHDTWSNSQLQALTKPTSVSFKIINAQNGNCKKSLRMPPGNPKNPTWQDALHPPSIRCFRSPPLSSFPLFANWPCCPQPEPTGKMLKMLRKDVAPGCQIKE